MENNSDDIILPETSEIVHEEAPAPKKSPKNKKPLLIVASVVGFLVLAGSLVFVILSSTKSSEPEPTEKETPAGKYDADELQEILDMADNRIKNGEYTSAKQLLEAYSATERMTATQRYRYCVLFSKIYAPSALNDEALARKYNTLAEYARELIIKGEE